jgi:hypothetical protein
VIEHAPSTLERRGAGSDDSFEVVATLVAKRWLRPDSVPALIDRLIWTTERLIWIAMRTPPGERTAVELRPRWLGAKLRIGDAVGAVTP